ncbi:Hypothetical predicted protein [Podarcis lilfordi]|uniref:Uncharacterized protein n=1 Tax=Podarcis lilfordi TaxID=74358 RepID=A0AA35JSM7_9SAUR|nr:Hypothetical predicted protein [Podarcis lilfordi]
MLFTLFKEDLQRELRSSFLILKATGYYGTSSKAHSYTGTSQDECLARRKSFSFFELLRKTNFPMGLLHKTKNENVLQVCFLFLKTVNTLWETVLRKTKKLAERINFVLRGTTVLVSKAYLKNHVKNGSRWERRTEDMLQLNFKQGVCT